MKDLIIMMYASSAFINAVSFIPQILKLLKDKTKSDALSLQTQFLWLYAVTSGLLYAVFIMKDPVLIMAVSVTFSGCVAVSFLAFFNRFKGHLFDIHDKSLYDIMRKTEVGKTIKKIKMYALFMIL